MSNYIQALNENAERTNVRYNNRYGLALAGDLYNSRDLDKSRKHMAVIVGAPYGGVKEQGPCVYANELALRGFVVLTFDPCYMGESAGEPRHVSSPDLFSENISAGVDFLGMLPYVDREKIAAVGICGSGGFALSAAAADTRIKAVVTASMYDMSVAARIGMTDEQIQKRKEKLSLQRWIDAENGTPEYIPSFPEEAATEIPGDLQGIWREFFEFYATKRGHHPNALGNFTTTSELSFMNYSLNDHIAEISPRPILFIVGEQAESRFFSDMAYEKAAKPKQMIVVPNCNHVDLYDDSSKIPFTAIEDFLKDNLNN
ncbi:alpha/beta hydrolase [Ruminococcus sp. Marseille-P6503]|uniref:alpha/beta hydrolase n=1 Tax=Ruminococcus sp. Marseille-P6503 TaxID=2364796 RepID=UPI000F52F3E5|nr:alpha/beta hydrolase [Ruminococcus sp. Marseille-P6503]